MEREFVEEPKKGIKEEVQVEKENNNLDIKKLIGAMNVILEECSSIREEISELKSFVFCWNKKRKVILPNRVFLMGVRPKRQGSLLSNDTQKNIGGMSDDHIASILG